MYRQRVFIEKDGDRVPLDVVIHDAVPSGGSTTEYTCDIEAPGLFVTCKQIRGVCAEQAVDLAERFVNARLADVTVYDATGQRVRSIGTGKTF